MFHGSIPAAMQAILAQVVKGWDCSDIYVGCSGNFTVERVLHSVGDWKLHGNDVNILSATIGRFLAGDAISLTLSDKAREECGWMAPYLETDLGKCASVMIASNMARGFGKRNAYYERINKAFEQQWPEMHRRTVDKIKRVTFRLKSFGAEDVCTWIDRADTSQGFISYPPFYAMDYESQFEKMDRMFEWDKPAYTFLEEEAIQDLFDKFTKFRFWAFGSHRALPKFEEFKRGITQTTNRGIPITIYSNGGMSQIVMPHQEMAICDFPRLAETEDLGADMRIRELSQGEFQTLRSEYMNPHIKPGQASIAFGVFVDGKLIGCFALAREGKIPFPGPSWYLLSDFPIAPTRYRHLAKLMLYAALSKEAQLAAEQFSRGRVRSLVTTAFSQRPVSMKYRGLFDLVSRKETAQPVGQTDISSAYYAQKFMLNYGAIMGGWTLNEGLAIWKERYGNALGKGERE